MNDVTFWDFADLEPLKSDPLKNRPPFADAKRHLAWLKSFEKEEPRPLLKPRLLMGQVEIPEYLPPVQFKQENLTAPRGGIFRSAFEKEIAETRKARLDSELAELNAEYFNEFSPAGRPKVEKARLVKERKSPTRPSRSVENALKQSALARFEGYLHRRGESVAKKSKRDIVSPVGLYRDDIGKTKINTIHKETGEIIRTVEDGRSPVARLSHRDWSGEYRIRVTVDTSPSNPPPQQAGDRVTKFLTTRAAKNILDSGAYVSAVRGGYTTFLTLTFKPEARERILSGESTIGKECSRFFDAMQKMYQRGWIADAFVQDDSELKRKPQKSADFFCIHNDEQEVEPASDKLDYLWVAEAPINEHGEVNPHCHVLMRWNVPPYLFREWARRIESNWGQGIAKLERIKTAEAASGYLLKALGYLLKGDEKTSDQGEIKGNRYNISKPARAPDWENIANFHAEHMSSIIGEIKIKLENRAKPTVRQIQADGKKIDELVKAKSIKQNQGKETATVDARIKQLEARIKKAKAHLRASPVRAHDYLINFKDKTTLSTFLNWAVGVRFWNMADSSSDAPVSKLEHLKTKVDGVRKSFSKVRNRYIDNEARWQALLTDVWQMFKPEPNPDEFNQDIQEYLQWNHQLAM